MCVCEKWNRFPCGDFCHKVSVPRARVCVCLCDCVSVYLLFLCGDTNVEVAAACAPSQPAFCYGHDQVNKAMCGV